MSRTLLPPSLVTLLDEGGLFEDKYRLLRPIGEGSFASVIHARHEAMDRDVALKCLRPDVLKKHPEVGERFLTEVRLASRLTSTHTVTIFDFGQTTEQIPYMVLEYVDGRPLDYAIGKYGDLGLKRSIRITMQILESLDEAHGHRIIHRDLKPANIMVGKGRKKEVDGVHAKVLDFGVAKLVEQAEENLSPEDGRHSTQFIGTPRYMSPEQILGKEVSPASDLYSVGLIFFEMCTGNDSIPEENVAKVAQAHLAEQPLDLAGLDELPRVLKKIIRKATSRQVEDRFQKASEFHKALEEAVESGRQKHRQATAPAVDNSNRKYDSTPVGERTSDVFSGAGYVEAPKEEGMAKAPSSTGSRSVSPVRSKARRHPSPPQRERKSEASNRPGRRSSSVAGVDSAELTIDTAVEKERIEEARRRRHAQRRKSGRVTKQEFGEKIRRGSVALAVLLGSGFVGFVIVGGSLSILAAPMRYGMGLLPVGFALLWSTFSGNASYNDFLRRTMIPWARRSVTMVVLALVVLTLVMPDQAGQSLQDDALWFMSSWPEPIQMGWLVSLTEGICHGASWLMSHVSSLVPWSF